jgi:hypothetical protein
MFVALFCLLVMWVSTLIPIAIAQHFFHSEFMLGDWYPWVSGLCGFMLGAPLQQYLLNRVRALPG